MLCCSGQRPLPLHLQGISKGSSILGRWGLGTAIARRSSSVLKQAGARSKTWARQCCRPQKSPGTCSQGQFLGRLWSVTWPPEDSLWLQASCAGPPGGSLPLVHLGVSWTLCSVSFCVAFMAGFTLQVVAFEPAAPHPVSLRKILANFKRPLLVYFPEGGRPPELLQAEPATQEGFREQVTAGLPATLPLEWRSGRGRRALRVGCFCTGAGEPQTQNPALPQQITPLSHT